MDPVILAFLAAPIAASLIIAGIHAYLGLHVVERGVIFVDLSLAQIASLGAAIAVWQGYDPHEPAIYWMSLVFTPDRRAHLRADQGPATPTSRRRPSSASPTPWPRRPSS